MAEQEDQRTCYYPDGSIAENNVPCTSKEYTSCCGTTDICLTNGLCMNTGHQPYLLSRGACTKQEWGKGCSGFCKTDPEDMTRGVSIVNLHFTTSSPATYCCGNPELQDGKLVCPDGDEDGFEVNDGDIIFGRGALANTTAPISSTCPSPTAGSGGSEPSVPGVCATTQCNDTAIGAGVGVPLGLVALGSIAWAIWERRKAKRAYAAAGGGPGGPVPWSSDVSKGGYQNQGVYAELQHPPVELGDSNPPAHQLADTERRR